MTFALPLLTFAAAVGCRPLHGIDGPVAVAAAVRAVGLDSPSNGIRVSTATHVLNMAYQSDRMYPPYLWSARELRVAAEWARGLLRVEQGSAQSSLAFLSDSARRAVLTSRGAILLPAGVGGALDERALDAWTVLADWRGAADLRASEECLYRDYWRPVVERRGPQGAERLFLDRQTNIPVKLERREPHYLWGDVLAEYVWSVWTPVRGSAALAPGFAFRLVDGEVDEQRSYAGYRMVSPDSVGTLAIPPNAAEPPAAAGPAGPDTVRVGPTTFLLTSRGYRNVVTLQRDTVFVLDAQLSAERARQDSSWIGRLFPGRHPVVLVVSDLAWPHIAGVRYWVAAGASVVSRRASGEFLGKVVRRVWTLQPDLLESRAARKRFRFTPVDERLDLAGGALQLRAIDGIGGEGALLAFIPGEQFLYAGDYIQGGGPASFSAVYARDVAAAVRRNGLVPARFAAMHTPLTSWAELPRFTGP